MRIVILALVAVLLPACRGDRQPDLLKLPPEQQIETAKQLSTTEVYSFYKAAFELPPPPLPILHKVLGERGEEALELWISDLQQGTSLDDAWEYGPLLSEVKTKSDLTLCDRPELLAEAAERLARRHSVEASKFERHLRGYC